VLPTLDEFVIQFLIMEVAHDFLLYWGHRIQHDIPFLWKHFHSLHHDVETVSAISTGQIHTVDAFLQGEIPILGAAIFAQAHPVSFFVSTIAQVSQNVLNHSGLDSPILDFLAMRWLPGRAPPKFHDYHHQFVNYSGNAKNFGENFRIWDIAFGTASKGALNGIRNRKKA